jgi:hypothetical protein
VVLLQQTPAEAIVQYFTAVFKFNFDWPAMHGPHEMRNATFTAPVRPVVSTAGLRGKGFCLRSLGKSGSRKADRSMSHRSVITPERPACAERGQHGRRATPKEHTDSSSPAGFVSVEHHRPASLGDVQQLWHAV